jgi:hypothetical protein
MRGTVTSQSNQQWDNGKREAYSTKSAVLRNRIDTQTDRQPRYQPTGRQRDRENHRSETQKPADVVITDRNTHRHRQTDGRTDTQTHRQTEVPLRYQSALSCSTHLQYLETLDKLSSQLHILDEKGENTEDSNSVKQLGGTSLIWYEIRGLNYLIHIHT